LKNSGNSIHQFWKLEMIMTMTSVCIPWLL